MNGTVAAYNAETGELLWSFSTGSRTYASPIAYMHDGKQYIAFLESLSNTSQVDANDDPNAAARYSRAGTTLYVFTLPENVAGGM